MNIKEIINQKLKKCLDKQADMNFAEFLHAVRKAYGRSRRTVCEELKFSEMRMFCLENGTFRFPIPQDEIELLADYYDVDIKLLRNKAHHFIMMDLGKSQCVIGSKKR